MSHVKIREVDFTVEITEPIGPLSPEDVKKIASLVLETVERRDQIAADRDRDTRVHDRVWDPDKD